jgi:hypothetical protein
MADFIIDPQSASVSSQRNDLLAFLESLPDADQWSVFFSSTTGRTLVDLLAAFSALLKYETIAARREAYLQFALNRSSEVAASQFLGYSVFRGRNVIFKINITPATTGIWSKYHILGTIKDRDLILLEQTAHNAGVPIDVYVVAGVLKDETITASTSGLDVFRFTQKNVSEDLRIFIGVNEVSYSKEIVDLLTGKFVLQSNPYGSVDAKYLNYVSFTYRYNVGNLIKLEWVELKDFSYTLSDIAIDVAEGTVNASEVYQLFQEPESSNEIKINAPLNNETKFVIRAREDQPKILRQIDTSIIDAKGEDTPVAATMRLFYLRQNDFRFSSTEKSSLISKLMSYRPHGLKPCVIGDPVRNPITLKIDLYLSSTPGDPVNETKAIIAEYEYKLEQSLNFLDIEQLIEALDSIKVARIQLTGSAWSATTKYEIGSIVKATPDNGKVYRLERIKYFSGASEPTWPLVGGNTVNDGDIVWKAIPKDDTAGINTWAATTDYIEYNQVKPSVANGFIYEAIEFRNFSNSVEPVWPPLSGDTPEDLQGTTIYDGDLIWMARVQEGTPSSWVSTTRYKAGDLVKATNQITSDTVGVMFQCLGFVGTSLGSQPSFPVIDGNTVSENNIEWKCLNPLNSPAQLDVNEYYKISTSITVN